MNVKLKIVLITSMLVIAPPAYACGGGGVTFRDWINNTFTLFNVLGPVNSMLLTAVEFFSVQQNVNDFGAGRAAIEGLSAANNAVDSGVVGGGAMGFTSGQHDMTLEQYESLFK